MKKTLIAKKVSDSTAELNEMKNSEIYCSIMQIGSQCFVSIKEKGDLNKIGWSWLFCSFTHFTRYVVCGSPEEAVSQLEKFHEGTVTIKLI